MVKAKKGNTVILGLSDLNIKYLKEGKPIRFSLKELGMDDTIVYIFNGKDEETMAEMMKDQIGKETIIHDHRNTNKN